MAACGDDGKTDSEGQDDQEEVDEGEGPGRNVEVIRMVKLALDRYATDHDGNYPDSLSEIADAEELEDAENALQFVAADGTVSSWKYVEGLSQRADVKAVILYAPVAEGEKRLMCTLSGRSIPIPEAEFQAAMRGQRATVEGP